MAALTQDSFGSRTGACLELNCSGYLLKPATITFGPNGAAYRVHCGPLTPADEAALEHAAATAMAVRLVFSDGKELLLTRVQVQRVATGWAWIEGAIVENPI